MLPGAVNNLKARVAVGRAGTPCAPRLAEDCEPYLTGPLHSAHSRMAEAVPSIVGSFEE